MAAVDIEARVRLAIGANIRRARESPCPVRCAAMLTYQAPPDPVAVVDELAPLYARVFGEPSYLEGPEDVRGFVRNYTEDADHPGLGVVVARDDDTVLGFGYGTARPPGEWWPGASPTTPKTSPRTVGDRGRAVTAPDEGGHPYEGGPGV